MTPEQIEQRDAMNAATMFKRAWELALDAGVNPTTLSQQLIVFSVHQGVGQMGRNETALALRQLVVQAQMP